MKHLSIITFVILILASCTESPQKMKKVEMEEPTQINKTSKIRISKEIEAIKAFDDRRKIPKSYIDKICKRDDNITDSLVIRICLKRNEIIELLKVNHSSVHNIAKDYSLFMTELVESGKKNKYSDYMVNKKSKEFYLFENRMKSLESPQIIKVNEYNENMRLHRKLMDLGVYYVHIFETVDSVKFLSLDYPSGYLFYIADSGYVTKSFQYFEELFESKKVCDNFYYYQE